MSPIPLLGFQPQAIPYSPTTLLLGIILLTVGGCGLLERPKSRDKIAAMAKESLVLISYKNRKGHGTGFFVEGEKGRIHCRIPHPGGTEPEITALKDPPLAQGYGVSYNQEA